MMKLMLRGIILPLFPIILFCTHSFSQVSITATGTPLTQDFNTLATSGTTNVWTDNTTLVGWYSNRTVYIADAGTSTTGALYSYGSTASTERALGGLSSSSTSPSFAIRLVNNSGSTLSGLALSFRGEQWRQTANSQALTFDYQVGATSITTGTWTTAAAFNFTALKTGTAGALDGNAAGNFTTISGTLSVTVNPGQEIWLRWSKTGTTSPGLAIDDLSITANAAISSNADLSNLTLSTGTLNPVFASGTTSYTSTVANGVTSVTVTPTTADINATVTVNGNAVTSGSPSASIPLNVGVNTITTVVTAQDATTTKTYTIDVTRAAAGVATLTASSSLADFGNICINSTAGPNSFTLDGSSLDGTNIDIAALTGFTFSESPGGPFTSTLSFTYSGNSFTGKIIYVEFSPVAVQSYNGNISLSGGGLPASYTVPATGSGINTPATVTTGGSSAVTATSGTVAGTINATGCSAISAYGIEYSSISGFPNGTGTQITSSNLSSGNYSVNLTSLAPNTRYYYKAYVTDGSGTVYGAQQAFTCTPLPVVMSAQSSLTYTEAFDDIANWSNFFITGTGANHFSGNSAGGSGSIPNGTNITASTQSFVAGNPGSSGGVQRGNEQIAPANNIVLLSTGSADNTSSAAIDLFLDFTGVNAGTLSFDWASINNSTGDRNGSMRVYTSTDGVTFTELTFASVLNFTNNSPTNGTKANIALPSSFDNSATARIRFYYHNGSGGTTGSRPKISIDNLIVTAVATTPCVAPTAPATNLVFGTITDVSVQGSFTPPTPASDQYLVVASVNSSLTGNPVDGQIYNIGDNLGDGTVVAKGSSTSFTATGLTASTTYYFFIFPLNAVCTGGPLYYTTSVLSGSATTAAGLPPCTAPASQPTTLVFGTTGVNSIQGSFTATTADEYLVLRSTSSTLSNNPVDATVYSPGDVLGNAVVVERSTATSFTATGLAPNTQYYFFIFSINSQACVNGPVYNTTAPLNGTQTTQPLPPCAAPSAQPTQLALTASNTSVSGTFSSVIDADDYLVVASTSPTLSGSPVDNTDYTTGDALGGGTVVYNSSLTTFMTVNLTPNTTYYFFVFAANKNCSGGTKYAAGAALTGNIVTTNLSANNYYFGTLHSHSDYSDGNQDHPGYTPTDDYNYAMTAQCMDYLGISEHNHFSSANNPGNTITLYHSGPVEANNFTAAHPGFLALYGMEWGVISGGGHVVIYGDGMDDLWGWESGSGGWGATNNYDVYVPKSVYTGSTGLFKTVNDNVAKNTFATLAHPNLTDYNNIANTAYDAVADNAITGSAVESGPATSTNTTYSNPGSSMFYLWYYQTLLSKGYHLGPTIDHDNHNTTFGHTTYSRTAIIAPALTKTAIIGGMRNMNFYATQDCDTKVDFTINTKIMGSTIIDRYAPNISVQLTDASTSLSSAVIRVMYGVPGSGVLPVKIDSAIGSSLKFADVNLANNVTGYYYIDITNGSSRIVTAPIWYTRNDNSVLAVKLTGFDVQKIDNVAKLTWSTEQEVNSNHFDIERSVDGRTWTKIGITPANGNSSHRVDYTAYDNAPMRGVNYYRLKEVSNDGKFDYSDIRKVLFNTDYTAQVAPNPAKDVINLYLSKTTSQVSTIQMLNVSGKLVYSTTTKLSSLQIPVAGMAKGIYFIKITNADNTITLRAMVE
ncbi:MAG: cadherin-like beta sandwich domain-containing protein [Bacteroidetes bacterium]|nr:cadherin-like beta sandwich domain-containing protein [Bacteroidota bacterium]